MRYHLKNRQFIYYNRGMCMRSNKKEALIQFHRENILQTAERLFMEQSVEGTTMDDIAREAEYSKATLYVYFKNKEEIVNAIVLKSMEQLRDNIHQAIEQATNWTDGYYNLCQTLANFFSEDAMASEASVGEAGADPDSKDATQVEKDIFSVNEEINAELTAFLVDGIAEGYLREDIPIIQTMFMIWASITGIVKTAEQKQQYMEKYLELSKDDFLKDSFTMLLRSIKC